MGNVGFVTIPLRGGGDVSPRERCNNYTGLVGLFCNGWGPKSEDETFGILTSLEQIYYGISCFQYATFDNIQITCE